MTDSDQKLRGAGSAPPSHEDGGERWDSESAGQVEPDESNFQSTAWDDGERVTMDDDAGVASRGLSNALQHEDVAAEERGSGETERGVGAVSPEVNQSLARLEMNSLQVKLYLDSIEQRISRMEPRLEGMRGPEPVPVPTSAPQAENHAVEDKPADEGTPVGTPVLSTTERRRRAQGVPVERRRAPHSVAVEVEDGEPWDWRGWLRPKQRRWAPVAVLGLVAIAGLSYWGAGQHGRTTGGRVEGVGPAAVSSGAAAVATSKSSADVPWTTSAGANRPSERRAEPRSRTEQQRADVATVEQGVVVPVVPATGGPVAAPLVTGTKPTDVKPTATEATGAISQAADGDDSAVDPRSTRTGVAPSPRIIPPSYARVHVSSGVMAGNLISSRQPAYPKGLAGLFHTEGPVVMQAIISKSGRVQNVRVISGHYMLRGAAKEAVRTWRYRPYYVNGVPVEVATIVSVEFHR